MKLSKRILAYLENLVACFELKPHGPEIVYPNPGTYYDENKYPAAEEYLFPPVIVWDPFVQHPDVFHNGFCCPHESHAGEAAAPLKPKKWKYGGSERDMPRKIYGRDGVVLLVSRVYVCPQGHEITAHDSRILVHLPTDRNNPFILSHKSGVTMGFMNEVNSLARSGMNFSEIEKHFAQHYYDKHWLQEKKWHDDLKSVKEKTSTDSSTIEDSTQDHFPDPAEWVELPSDDTIISCFVLNFREYEVYYTERMSELSALYLSADHTFKVAANIGVHLPDNKWVTQYDSLFCILNEKGQVVAWQLTKGTAFDHVENLLKGLKERLDKQGAVVKAIFVDNCCQFRKKIEKVFGSEVPVKLDLFHATLRVIQKIPKRSRHFMTHSCVSDFVNVFRKENDKEKDRKQETPSSQEMLDNLKLFLLKWKDVKHGDDEDVLTASAIHEIDCLKRHIEKGCLSNIPPGAGSERNENLHRNLRHIIARSRLGVESALALFTIFFYCWNEKKEQKYPKGIITPISQYSTKLQHSAFQQTSERFGLKSSAGIPEDFKTDVSQFLSSSTDVPELHSLLAQPGDSEPQSLPLHNVLTKGLNFLLVDKELRSMSDSRSYNPRLVHLMACSLTLFSGDRALPVKSTPEESNEALDRVLMEYGFERSAHPDEFQREESFFFALLGSIEELLSRVKEESADEYHQILEKLSDLGITAPPHLEQVRNNIRCIRNQCSLQLLQNAAVYQKLVVSSDIDYMEEAENFKKDNYFRGKYFGVLVCVRVLF